MSTLTIASETQPEMPAIFILQKMGPNEITDESSRICSSGHFFPLSIAGVPASDYDAPIYRLTSVDSANGITTGSPA